nr:hypothetical protein [Erwinia tracheiphila]
MDIFLSRQAVTARVAADNGNGNVISGKPLQQRPPHKTTRSGEQNIFHHQRA